MNTIFYIGIGIQIAVMLMVLLTVLRDDDKKLNKATERDEKNARGISQGDEKKGSLTINIKLHKLF